MKLNTNVKHMSLVCPNYEVYQMVMCGRTSYACLETLIMREKIFSAKYPQSCGMKGACTLHMELVSLQLCPFKILFENLKTLDGLSYYMLGVLK